MYTTLYLFKFIYTLKYIFKPTSREFLRQKNLSTLKPIAKHDEDRRMMEWEK